MRTNVHNPQIDRSITTLESGTHVVVLTDREGGDLVLFLKSDWSDWDAVVAAVDKYRAARLRGVSP